jgi:hypothetical protein
VQVAMSDGWRGAVVVNVGGTRNSPSVSGRKSLGRVETVVAVVVPVGRRGWDGRYGCFEGQNGWYVTRGTLRQRTWESDLVPESNEGALNASRKEGRRE